MMPMVVAPTRAPDFLFTTEEEAMEAISKSVETPELMQGAGGPGKLSSRSRGVVAAQVARAILEVIDLELGDLLLAGWTKHDALTEAAAQSLAAGEDERLVDLATHVVTSTHKPHVEILMDDVPIAKIDVELRFDFLVKAAIATVADGHLTGLRSGMCETSCTLTVLGREVVRKQGTMDLGVAVRLHDPIPLVHTT